MVSSGILDSHTMWEIVISAVMSLYKFEFSDLITDKSFPVDN